jgi:poly-beta-hydroxyalkanoate depolymerase
VANIVEVSNKKPSPVKSRIVNSVLKKSMSQPLKTIQDIRSGSGIDRRFDFSKRLNRSFDKKKRFTFTSQHINIEELKKIFEKETEELKNKKRLSSEYLHISESLEYEEKKE